MECTLVLFCLADSMSQAVTAAVIAVFFLGSGGGWRVGCVGVWGAIMEIFLLSAL